MISGKMYYNFIILSVFVGGLDNVILGLDAFFH